MDIIINIDNFTNLLSPENVNFQIEDNDEINFVQETVIKEVIG